MRRDSNSYLRWVGIALILGAFLLTVLQLVTYSRLRSAFPANTTIAGIAVGGLTQQQAADRLTQAYSLPIEAHYGDAVFQIRPSSVGFEINVTAMVTAADVQRVNQPFWVGFWNYLWNQESSSINIPLSATIPEDRLRSFLEQEIAARYDQLPVAAMPVAGTVNFSSGETGEALNIDRAMTLIESAMRSSTNRVVNLTYNQVEPPRPSLANLQILLQQIIDLSGFDGITEVYVMDLESGEELNFAYTQGENIPPGIAFTAASTIKIPIMVSVFRREDEPLPTTISSLITDMIDQSENPPADSLMELVIDPNLGPMGVTEDMQALGLENTFLAGEFAVGSPLLQRYVTPANSRTDVDTSPDPYNQTTPEDLGLLLADIYQCAENNGGTFAIVFPNEISSSECQLMINYLLSNRIAALIQAGLPDGTEFAHKHGWIVETDSLMHAITDAGIVYSPSGNFVIVISMYHPVQLIFDNANRLQADLGVAVYNYFNNIPSP
jgi:beta-lactamase class A